MVFDDFAVFSTFSTLVISDFNFRLTHQNRTFRGKLYEQLLQKKFSPKVPRFRDFELRSVIFDDFGDAKCRKASQA
jgi:ribosomal protein L5